MQNIIQAKIHTFTKILFGFFVATTFFFAGVANVQASGTITVKVLGILASGPIVGGTATGLSDGTIVQVKVKNAAGVVVGSANIPITNGNIGPQSVPATMEYGDRYVIESNAVNQIQDVLASSEPDIFYAIGVSSVSFYNATPTGIHIRFQSFGGDVGQDFGLLPLGEPGRMARMYYKPVPQNILGELLYQFLPDNTYLDFPFGAGDPPGVFLEQILLGLTPNTTYSYKITIAPTDEDENGQNDNYQTFVFPRPQVSDFIYSDTSGPLLYGGIGGVLPTFTTPNVVGGGWTYGGGQDGTTGGSNTNGNGNGGQPQVILPDIYNIHVSSLPESASFQATIGEGMPQNYTTSLLIYVSGQTVTYNGSADGIPCLSGIGTFSNVSATGLTPNTLYRYRFVAQPSDPNSTLSPIYFERESWWFTTPVAGTTTAVDATPDNNNNPTTGTHTSTFSNASGGLVPCSGTDNDPCTFNKLMTLINKVISFLIFTLALPLAAIAFAYAGFLFLTSGGNTENRSKAKGIFTTVFLGLIAAMAAWLIMYTIISSLGVPTSPTAGWSWLGEIGGN